jgi:hypothetical protein
VVFSAGRVITQCKVQLWLIDAVAELFAARFPYVDHEPLAPAPAQAPDAAPAPAPAAAFALQDAHLLVALDTLLVSVDLARRFNQDAPMRSALWAAGFLRDRQAFPPELYFHENHALKLYCTLLVRRLCFPATAKPPGLPEEPSDARMRELVTERLRAALAHVLPLYAHACRLKLDDVRRCMDVTVGVLVDGLTAVAARPQRLRPFLADAYPQLAALAEVGALSVRAAVARFLVHPTLQALLRCGLDSFPYEEEADTSA